MGNSISRSEARELQDSLDLCNKRLRKICVWIDKAGGANNNDHSGECDALLMARLVAARVPPSSVGKS